MPAKATHNLSLEREAAGEPHLAWPGEQAGSFSNWVVSLTDLLSTDDISILGRKDLL